MVRSTVWRADLPVFPRPPCKGLSAAAASPGLERYRILPPCPRPAPWGPLYEMGVLPGGPVPLSVRLQRAGCTCGTARNISNHGGLSYAYPMPRRPSTRALVRQLPMTLTLAELNGNEKYARLPEALPTDAIQPGALQTGDLMLYGANCLVLFYQSFPSSYSYTPLGQIEHPDGLASVLGAGSVTVTLSILP